MFDQANQPIIELDHVTRLYGTVIGVNDLQLKMDAGAYGLVGPNGAGKTTLIGLLCGALRPSRGFVRVFGESPVQNARVLPRIGVCPSTELLLPRTTALAWVVELLMLAGFSYQSAKQRARNALERTGMGSHMYRSIDSYSLGMRQRVKLAQAIAHDPDLLILDEPFNGLDPIGRFEMTELLKGWCVEGKTLLLASHVLSEVEAVTNSFLLIYGGRLLATGTSDELRGMVADMPQEITLVGSDAANLSGRLAAQPWVDSVRLSEDRTMLKVTARHADLLYQNLTQWIAADGLDIHRMIGTDGGLADLFNTLTKRHRGFAR